MLRRSSAGASLLFGAAVLGPVILAGARDYTVGTDITTYGNYIFNAACDVDDLFRFLRRSREIEPMYKALAWAVSRFTNNPHWFYLVTALLICGCTMCGLFYYRRWCSVTLGWACFLFLFYGDTLNTMRQCLALALVFCAFPLFLEKKYLWFALLQGAAVLFHVTGLLALALPVLYILLEMLPPRWIQFFFIVGCMGVILLYSPLLGVVLRWGFLPAKFSRYMADGVAFALNPTILRLPFLLPVLFYYDRFCGIGQESAVWGMYGQESAVWGMSLSGQESAVHWMSGQGPSPDGPVWRKAFGQGEAGQESAEPEKTGMESLAAKGISAVTGMFVVILLLLEICTVQLRSVRPALYRISYYFGYYRFLAYPRLVRILRRDNRALIAGILLLYLCVLWYYQNVLQGNNQIYPYLYDPRWFWKSIPVMPTESQV